MTDSWQLQFIPDKDPAGPLKSPASFRTFKTKVAFELDGKAQQALNHDHVIDIFELHRSS
jgi:hypothetical protein